MTLFAANLYALALDPFLSPSPESWDAPGFVSMTNDSFGPGPVDEWDDLDSFGMRLGLPLGPVRLLSAISGLTDRTDSAADANRLDQASLGAAVSVLDSAPAQLLAGAGIDATGDLGGLLIQEGLHSGTGVDRPVPTSYSSELAAAPLGFFKLSISSASSLSPYLVMAGRASIPSRGSLLAVAGLRYSRPDALLAMSGGWRVVGGDAPATLLAVDAAENGPYLGFQMRVGLLALAFEDIPLRRKTNGSLGIVLGSPRPPDGSRPISLDLGLVAGSSVAQRVRLGALLHGGRDGVHEEGFLAFAQGWFTSDHPDATATMFAEYSAGGSIGAPFADGLAHLDAGVGPFFSFEQLSTLLATSSVPLGSRDSFGLAAETGFRVTVPVENMPVGLGWRVRWRALQATLMTTGAPFSGRGSLDFELFVFSEG